MNVESGRRWAVILAGGEGLRLRPLTSRIAGDHRPKQFCALLGHETLFERTRRRAALVAGDERTLLVLTRAHQRFYAPLVADAPAGMLVVQPEGRGTAPAIVYALLRIAAAAPTGTVALLPSDHYVSDDVLFMAHVRAAFAAAEARPDLVILLGIAPTDAEPEYGWIEPGEPILGDLRRVRCFWEKPGPQLAETLLQRGCLWNSFVMVGGVAALISLIRAALPDLLRAFAPLGAAMGTAGETAVAEAIYACLSPESFSDAVLAGRPANLAVLPVRGVEWNDWGRPERVLATLARLGIEPEWAERRLARLASRRHALGRFDSGELHATIDALLP